MNLEKWVGKHVEVVKISIIDKEDPFEYRYLGVKGVVTEQISLLNSRTNWLEVQFDNPIEVTFSEGNKKIKDRDTFKPSELKLLF